MDKELEKPAKSPQDQGTQRQKIEGRTAPEAQQHKQPELAQPHAVAQKQQRQRHHHRKHPVGHGGRQRQTAAHGPQQVVDHAQGCAQCRRPGQLDGLERNGDGHRNSREKKPPEAVSFS
jgi:hypothetical protein